MYDLCNNFSESDLLAPAIVNVNGISMLPELIDGDKLIVCKNEPYLIGDIIVFHYLNEGVLVHRLLKIVGEQYYCKGDNSFRLECISKSNIIGKVVNIIRNGRMIKVKVLAKEYIDMSFKISRLFLRSHYDTNLVVNSDLYRRYCSEYLKNNNQVESNTKD